MLLPVCDQTVIAALQRVLDQFESLTLGPGAPAAPGQPVSGGLDITTLPRPVGELASQIALPPPLPPAYDSNCPPRFLRLSVNAAPSSQVGCPGSTHVQCPGSQENI